MRPLVRSVQVAQIIWLLLAAVGISAHDLQTDVREFFGIPYKHPQSAELTAAREKAYSDMLWIQGVMSGSIFLVFLVSLYSLVVTSRNSAHTKTEQAKAKAEQAKKMKQSDEQLLHARASWTFEVE